MWYAHLVTLSNARAEDASQRVVVIIVDDKGRRRDRSPDTKTNALTLHQGRSSAAGGNDSDKSLVAADTITLQIHRLRVGDAELRALALYVPKDHDAIAGGSVE